MKYSCSFKYCFEENRTKHLTERAGPEYGEALLESTELHILTFPTVSVVHNIVTQFGLHLFCSSEG